MEKQVRIEVRDTINNVLGTFDIWAHDEFPLVLNYQIADIRKIDKRSGSFSKDFKLPATKNNSLILRNIWDTNVVDTSKWFESKPCQILVDDVPVLRGNIKLKNIIQHKSFKEYEFNVFGNTMEWAPLFSELYINALDYGTVANPTDDITYSKADIELSWSSDNSTLDYYYPVINYGQWSNLLNGVVVEDLRPALYIRNMLDKAFENIGWTFVSTFFDSADFKKLVYAWRGNSWDRGQTYIDDNTTIVERSGVAQHLNPLSNNFNVWQHIELQAIISDPANQWVVNTFIPDKSGWFKIFGNILLTTNSHIFVGPPSVFNSDDFRWKLGVFKNGVEMTSLTQNVGNARIAGFNSPYIYLLDTDQLQIKIAFVQNIISSMPATGLTYANIDPSTTLSNGARTNHIEFIPESNIIRDVDYKIKNTLADDISILDILKGLTHSFNLYIDTDSANKILTIEPRENFYLDANESIDYTNKLDLDQDYTIKFVAELEREYGFKYKEDSNDGHLNQRNEVKGTELIAGQYIHYFSDRFKKGRKMSVNPTFAYTYHIEDIRVTAIPPLGSWKKELAPLMARMWKEFSADNVGCDTYYDFAPRLLYKDFSIQDHGFGQCKWVWEGVIQTTFPSALSNGYTDIPTNEELSYNNTGSTNKGLFQTYYSKLMAQIEKGTMLDCFIYLSTKDINELTFRKYVYFDAPNEIKGYWAINRIIDYNPLTQGLTKVELFKLANVEISAMDPLQIMGLGKPLWNYGDIDNDQGMSQDLTTWQIGSYNGMWNVDLNDIHDDQDTGSVLNLGPGILPTEFEENQTITFGNASQMVLGEGLQTDTYGQYVIGKYNRINEDDIFSIGVGSSASVRKSAIRISKDGIIRNYGGSIYYEDRDNVNEVLIEINGEYLPVYQQELL